MEMNDANFILATPSAKQVPRRELAGTVRAAVCKEDKRKQRVSICPACSHPWRAFRGPNISHNVLLGHKMMKQGRTPGWGSSSPGTLTPAAKGLATACAQLREVVGTVARTAAGPLPRQTAPTPSASRSLSPSQGRTGPVPRPPVGDKQDQEM